MIIERFSKNVIGSGVFKLYIAIGFFSTLIFFVINANQFTPLEMLLGIVGITILLKGICNFMLSLIIMFFNLENKKDEMSFTYNSEKIDSLLNELSIKESSAATSN